MSGIYKYPAAEAMTVKEYLNQAPRLDLIIDLKLAQVERLKSLRERVTSILGDTPKGSGRGDRVAEITIKIWSLEEEINRDIDRFVDTKADIRQRIGLVTNDRYRTVLEYRYLLGYKWEKISAIMDIELRWLYRIHGRALQQIHIPNINSKSH